MTLCIYGVMLYDDMSEFPAPDTYVYLTRDAAQRRADRKTYEYAGVRYWAEVYEIKCGWNAAMFGPFEDDRKNWLRFADYVYNIKYELYQEIAENAKLRELVRNLVYATHPIDRAKLIENAVELGIEV